MIDSRHLLNDEAMRDFILNGYVRVKTDLPKQVLEQACSQTDNAAQRGKVGANILAQAPALGTVLNHAVVRGALTSILGPNYCNSGSRHCHHMPPQPQNATPGWHRMDEYLFHKDDFTPARHRCRIVMSVFYPHDCTPDMGPTAIIPGSQYYTRTASAYCHDSMQTDAPVGTVTFIHYDMWHGGTCNYSNKNRFMMKFTFVRMEEPTQPTWNCRDTTWKLIERGPSGQQHHDMWNSIWNWHCGKPAFNGGSVGRYSVNDIPRLIGALRDEDESVSLRTAYALARIGEPAVDALLKKLIEESAAGPDENLNGRPCGAGGKPCQLFYAGYGLSAIGVAAVPGLTRLLGHDNWWVRGAAADVLREMGQPARGATQALTRVLHDEHEQVRCIAAEALGTVAASSDDVITALTERLEDKDCGVRNHAAGALARIRPTPAFAVPRLIQALLDESFYVRAYALVGLERIGTAEARRAIAEFLESRPEEVCMTAQA